MARDIPSVEPTEIVKGETVKWYTDPSDFPTSEGWTVTYSLRGPSSLDVEATVSGTQYLVTLTATQTDGLEPGDYWWQSYAELGTERYKISSGELAVVRDLADAAEGYDGRTTVKKTLDALDAMILGKASKDQRQMTVGDRQLTRLSPTELIKWREIYRAEYQREQAAARIANGLESGRKILVRFNDV